MLVNALLSARAYKKLTIGADGLSSGYLPATFLQVFLRELGQRQIKFTELCFDLKFKLSLQSSEVWLSSGTSMENDDFLG